MAWGLLALKADTKTRKAMQTPAAKAKGMKLKTKTMNVMKTPVAKENMKARRLPVAKVDASQRTLIRIEDPANACVLHLTSSMSYCEILRRLQRPRKRGLRLHAATIHGHACVMTLKHGHACVMTTE